MADTASPLGARTGLRVEPGAPASEPLSMPRTPLLGWASFAHAPPLAMPAVDALPQRLWTTSGRAAIFHALRQLKLPPGATVGVPTYHCPTMVAPVLRAGLRPRFYPLDADGLPDLAALGSAEGPLHAVIAAHFFGLPRSFGALRAWCDAAGVPLIEDCAHSWFGQAGERPVGQWGDWATASVSKFFPVPEGGVLASARHRLEAPDLAPQSLREQVKGAVDLLEIGVHHRRFQGLNRALEAVFRLKNGGQRWVGPTGTVDPSPDAEAMMAGCDMGRIECAPLAVTRWVVKGLPRARLVHRRRANYASLLQRFDGVPGARPLRPALPDGAVPYVFPLWVDDADFVYHGLRRLGAPVFRWDHIWPGTPAAAGDHGPLWSRHVLQVLCHQDLREADIERVAAAILHLLRSR